MKKTIDNIIKWGDARSITSPECRDKQIIKTLEELGEIAKAHLRNDRVGIIDGIGDVMVTLILLAKQYKLTLDECLNHAYNEIKDRTGKTVDGTFIKDNK